MESSVNRLKKTGHCGWKAEWLTQQLQTPTIKEKLDYPKFKRDPKTPTHATD